MERLCNNFEKRRAAKTKKNKQIFTFCNWYDDYTACKDYRSTAILYRVSTGPEQGFPCVVNSHREKPVFIKGNPCSHCRDPVFLIFKVHIIIIQQIEQFWCLETYKSFVPAQKQLAHSLFSSYSVKGKHCRKPHCRNGVVDHLEP